MTPVNTAMNTAMPQVQPPQPSSNPATVDNVMQMMMARATSVPIATMLFQIMGSVQQLPARPVFNQSPLFSPVSQLVPAQMPSPTIKYRKRITCRLSRHTAKNDKRTVTVKSLKYLINLQDTDTCRLSRHTARTTSVVFKILT